MDYRQLLIDHLDVVERMVRLSARRHRLPVADAEEFASVVRFKLVEHDFAILRRFEGRSQLTTYLNIVVERLCLDFCRAKWGKWAPSSSAIRLGPVATLLEQLISREGITFDEAVATLQTNHRVSETREELHDLLLQLPLRHRTVEDVLQHRANHDRRRPDVMLSIQRIEAALAAGLAGLTPQERQILVLRFDVGLPIAHIARAMGEQPRPLYRRLERILRRLRVEMQRLGVEPDDIVHAVVHPLLSAPRGLTNADSDR